jgi:hypothetical protein
MSQPQFFKSTNNKQKPEKPDGDHETTVKGKISEGQT